MKFNFNGNSKKSGVYKLVNNKNGRIYIGSCKEFKGRWKAHRRSLIKGEHFNIFLQRDFNKCGLNAFEFFILDIVDGERENRLFVEQVYLDYYFDFANQCYNFNRNSTGAADVHWIENENLEHGKARPYKLISPDGKVFEGTNVTKFCLEHGLMQQLITKVLLGNRDSHKGWRQYKKELVGIRYNKLDQKRRSGRYYKFISPEGKIFEGINFSKFCKEQDLDKELMANVLYENQDNYLGWTLFGHEIIKKEHHNAVDFKLISHEGKVVEGINISRLCHENNLERSCILDIISGKLNIHRGWSKFKQEHIGLLPGERGFERKKKFKLLSPNKEIIDIFGFKKFCRENKLQLQILNKVLSGERNEYHGWKLYKEEITI